MRTSTTSTNKWIYVLVSILIAIAFWLVVRTGRNPDTVNRVRGVPVVVSGERALNGQGLMIESVSDETVTLTLSGHWNDIRQLDRNSVTAVLDVSRITEPGTYELAYTPSYPSSVASSALTLQNRDPSVVTVTVSKIYSKTFDVQPVLKGSVAAGYQAGEFILEPQTIQISGAQERVDRIDQVQVVLEERRINATFAGDLSPVLLDTDGNEIEQSGLTLSAEQIYVVLPVMISKQMDVTVDFVSGGGATKDNIEYSISPSSITVSGPASELSGLTEICLGTIDLAQVAGILEQEYPIYVPAGVENVSGITTASVRVSVEGLVTREFEVSDIQLVNVPAGYTATLKTQVRTVVLRGTKKALDKVQASQIKMVADLSGVANATGSYNVPARVDLFAGDNVGVVGQHNVVVNLKRN